MSELFFFFINITHNLLLVTLMKNYSCIARSGCPSIKEDLCINPREWWLSCGSESTSHESHWMKERSTVQEVEANTQLFFIPRPRWPTFHCQHFKRLICNPAIMRIWYLPESEAKLSGLCVLVVYVRRLEEGKQRLFHVDLNMCEAEHIYL